MENFRDLGGIISNDGRFVKKNYFFRSANLDNITQEDRALLKKLNIKSIIDYRSDIESKNNIEIEGVDIIRIPAMNFDSDNYVKFGSIEEMIKNMATDKRAYEFLKNRYYQLPLKNKAYHKLVEIVRTPEKLPVINHCMAGKDRTGFGSALILMILGVSRENIMIDYLKSNVYADLEIDKLFKKIPELNKYDRESLNYIFGVNEDYINESFKSIDENYGGTEKYLKNEFNFTNKEIEEIRKTYLDEK
ncbi:MAG: tyrosine-protein phosphatase [Clostridioides sp.]|jgi:protein-tyrosine phosphatase|nr:tyrosine-protein phosphatase [Clostridioides sp.]